MQNYGKTRPSLHTIRTLASGCHGDEVVWEINYIPSLLPKQFKDVFLRLFPQENRKHIFLTLDMFKTTPKSCSQRLVQSSFRAKIEYLSLSHCVIPP